MAADTRTHVYTNNAQSLLSVILAEEGTVITVEDGSAFPSPVGDQICKVTLEDPATGTREICNCTARSGNELTVEREQEGTTAQEWPIGTVVAHRNTAETMQHLEERSTGGGGSSMFDDLAIVRTRANSDGSRIDGTPGIDSIAWDCSEPGRYVITFTNGWFQEPPTCSATAVTTGVALTVNIEEVTIGGVIIQITSVDGSPLDAGFHLTCIGYIGVESVPEVTIEEFVDSGTESLAYHVSWTPAVQPGETVLSYDVYKIDSQTLLGQPTFGVTDLEYSDLVFLTSDYIVSGGGPDEPAVGTLYINDLDVAPLSIQYAYYVRALTDQDTEILSPIQVSNAPT